VSFAKVKAWAAANKAIAIVVGLLLLLILYRLARGLGGSYGGHSSPEDAIASGWVVYQAGITGWLEVSPDGKQSIMHNTGWTGDPFKTA
jgi:hypothetical protein